MKLHALLMIVTFTVCIEETHQKTSPCPAVFAYDERDDSHDSWFGTVRLKSNVPLYGVFVEMVFSSPVTAFGTFLGQQHTDDNIVFHVTDKSYQVRAGEIVVIKFYVRYSVGRPVPLLQQIRFNGQNICTSLGAANERQVPPDRVHNTPSLEIVAEAAYPHVVEPINSLVTQPHVESRVQSINSRPSSSPPGSVTTKKTGSQPVHSSPAHSTYTFPPRFGLDEREEHTVDEAIETPYEDNGNQHVDRRVVPTSSRPTGTNRPTPRSVPPNHGQPSPRVPLNADRGFDTLPRSTTAAAAATSVPKERDEFFAGDFSFIQKEGSSGSPHYINDGGDICGTTVPKANPLVTHGADSEHGQFPWHGALYRSMITQLKYLCGASLISHRASITAAHCVTLANSNRPVDAGSLLLYFGKIELSKWSGPEEDAQIQSIHIPAQYNHERFYSDIALLLLKDDVKYSNVVRPICLWNYDTDYKVLINKVGLVPGWGYNERRLVSSRLSYAQMPVVSHETCIWSNRDFFSRVTSDMSFCAGFKNGTSVCNGDSGGGMVFKISNRWYLRGVVSVSAALQDLLRCNVEHFVVFTDVAKFTTWIKNVISTNQ